MSENYTSTNQSSNDNDYLRLQIGDASTTITGTASYTISYTYTIEGEGSSQFDEFYFNLIGTEWEGTQISNIRFTVCMPKAFDTDKIDFSAGDTGVFDGTDVTYSYDKEHGVIEGVYCGTLHEGQALTLRIALEKGYFTARIITVADLLPSCLMGSLVLLPQFPSGWKGYVSWHWF